MRKNRKGGFDKRRWLTLCLLGLVLCALFLPNQVKILRMQGELGRLQKEEMVLRQRQKEIEERIRYYSSDAYVEEVARRDLGLVKPGEVLVVPAVPGEVQQPPKMTEQSPYGD